MLKNGDPAIALFQGMIETNVLAFNPGWDGNAGPRSPWPRGARKAEYLG